MGRGDESSRGWIASLKTFGKRRWVSRVRYWPGVLGVRFEYLLRFLFRRVTGWAALMCVFSGGSGDCRSRGNSWIQHRLGFPTRNGNGGGRRCFSAESGMWGSGCPAKKILKV